MHMLDGVGGPRNGLSCAWDGLKRIQLWNALGLEAWGGRSSAPYAHRRNEKQP